MFVTPAQTGARGSGAHLPFHFPFAGTPRSSCGRSRARIAEPTAKLSSGGRASPAATLGLTMENPRSPAGNPRGTRSAASSPRYLRDDVPVVEILDSSRRTRLDCSLPISRDACSRSESGSLRWGAAGAVPAVAGRHVRVTVGGVIYQI